MDEIRNMLEGLRDRGQISKLKRISEAMDDRRSDESEDADQTLADRIFAIFKEPDE